MAEVAGSRAVEAQAPFADRAAPAASQERRVPLALAEALDLLPQGVIATDGDGRVLWLNACAKRLIARKDGLFVTAGYLRAGTAAESGRLARLIALAVRPRAPSTPARGGATVVETDLGALALMVKAARIEPAAAGSRGGHDAAAGQRLALVFFSSPGPARPVPAGVLVDLYGLTPAEARIAGAIAAGDTPQDYADAAKVGVGTVRWHLKRVLEKTSCRRQSDLVRLILTGPAGALLHEEGETEERTG